MKSKKILILFSMILALVVVGGVVFANSGDGDNGLVKRIGNIFRNRGTDTEFKIPENMSPEKQEFLEKMKGIHEAYKTEIEELKEEYGITAEFIRNRNIKRLFICNTEVKAILDEYKLKFNALREKLGADFTRSNEEVKDLMAEMKSKLNEYREAYKIQRAERVKLGESS